jgi:hypothetical protein
MTPLRLDRAALSRRLAADIDPWVMDSLLDAFEPAMTGALSRNARNRQES